jgi:acyl-[acyl-carrier-protein]-phospholipid O-acyltransferase/long-chain-fatty-acid--[acyl-carrier-protein] ligase
MLGYLKADQPGIIQKQGEWYDTGDIVDIDEQGYITILGRAKRFAKIAGEMVSLMIIEDLAAAVFGHVTHAAIAVPDERKGEQIILYTESQELARETLLTHAKHAGVAEICLSKHIIFMESIPRLGNGKVDYVTLSKQHSVT